MGNDFEHESKLKAMHAEQARVVQELRSGMLGSNSCGSNETAKSCDPARPLLRDRVAMQLRRAENEGAKASRLAELQYLLDKNPEVARILELVKGI